MQLSMGVHVHVFGKRILVTSLRHFQNILLRKTVNCSESQCVPAVSITHRAAGCDVLWFPLQLHAPEKALVGDDAFATSKILLISITKYSHVNSCTESQRVTSVSTSHNPLDLRFALSLPPEAALKLRYVLSYFATRDRAFVCHSGWELPFGSKVCDINAVLWYCWSPVGI